MTNHQLKKDFAKVVSREKYAELLEMSSDDLFDLFNFIGDGKSGIGLLNFERRITSNLQELSQEIDNAEEGEITVGEMELEQNKEADREEIR